MTRKFELPNLDNLARRYQAGETPTELASELRCSPQTVIRAIKRLGLYDKGRPRHIIPHLAGILARYQAGESEQALATELGITRSTLRRRIIAAGIIPRGASGSMLIRWQTATAEDRQRMLDRTHEAAKGRQVGIAELCTHALSKERALTHATVLELAFAGRLTKRGLNITPQKAVGPYNIDVAVNSPPIAVEIFGGHWHTSDAHITRHFQRTEYLLDRGWTVLIVWVDGKRYILGPTCDNYIVALAERLSADPPARGEYRVILGNGEPVTTAKSYLNTPADIERLGCGH